MRTLLKIFSSIPMAVTDAAEIALQTQELSGLSMLETDPGKCRADSLCAKRKPIPVQKNMLCWSNKRGRGKLRLMSRKMLWSMNGENDQISSLSTFLVRGCPASNPEGPAQRVGART